MACISFSIVMPSLYIYLTALEASASFYALVVAMFSVGEAFGSLGLGALSTYIGTKRTMQLCSTCSFIGSVSYSLAQVCHDHFLPELGPLVVLFGRTMQGVGSGGQQATEQAYFSIAAPIEQRTELTGRLGTFASLGFIFGPAIGAFVASAVPTFAIGAIEFNVFTKVGWFVSALYVSCFSLTTLCFEEVQRPPEAGVESAKTEPEREPEAADEAAAKERLASSKIHRAVWALIAIFFVHFNGFAVQASPTPNPLPFITHLASATAHTRAWV